MFSSQRRRSIDCADGRHVGQHAAQPTVVDVELAGGLGGFLDGVLRLALAADEEDLLAAGGQAAEEVGRLVEALDGFLEVDDVDAALVLQQVGLHRGFHFLVW